MEESYPDSEEVIEATDVPEVETEIIYIEATEDDLRVGKFTFFLYIQNLKNTKSNYIIIDQSQMKFSLTL